MNLLQAENKARSFNSLVRTPSIEYRVVEVRRRYDSYDDEAQNLLEPQYKVVQVVGDIVWETY